MGNALCYAKTDGASGPANGSVALSNGSEKKVIQKTQRNRTASTTSATKGKSKISIKTKDSHPAQSSLFSSSSTTDFSESNPSPVLTASQTEQRLASLSQRNGSVAQSLGSGTGSSGIVFSRSPEGSNDPALINHQIFNNNNNNNNNRNSTAASSDNNTSYSLEKMHERNQVSIEYQWLEGRRYHNIPGASYLLPNDIDEVDRLQVQHFILRYAIQGNYKSPLEKSKVREILDIGCGPGTWTMEMANEFPDATITGIDMSAVFPSTIIPSNCRFIQHNILQGLPFPDNTFDYVYQRLLVAGLTPDDWVKIMAEIERVTKPGGYIELVEVDGTGGNNGPYATKIWGWVNKALLTRGVDTMIGRDSKLKTMAEQANIVNVSEEVLKLPTGDHGGKVGKLLKENELALWSAITPVVIHGAGVDKDEYEEAVKIAQKEVEEYKSYHIFYVIIGQKREPPANAE